MTPHSLLYDPDCGFCRVCVAVLLAWDRHGRLRPEPGEQLESLRLVLPGGAVRAGGDAFPPLLRLLPGGAPLAWLAERVPGLTRRAYDQVAAHRSLLGRAIPRSVRTWAERRISDSARRSR